MMTAAMVLGALTGCGQSSKDDKTESATAAETEYGQTIKCITILLTIDLSVISGYLFRKEMQVYPS